MGKFKLSLLFFFWSRFFENAETSVNSLGYANKREFIAKLAEFDAEYDKIMANLMDELSKKKISIKHEI